MQDIVSRSRGMPSVDGNMLLMAVICVRNCVKRHWTSRGGGGALVPEAERPSIRATTLRLIGECDGAVATQLCQLVANIARAEWPRAWPDLLPSVMASLSGPASSILSPTASVEEISIGVTLSCRWLKALNEIVKELSSMMMPAAKRTFKDTSYSLMSAIAPLYTQLMDQVRNF